MGRPRADRPRCAQLSAPRGHRGAGSADRAAGVSLRTIAGVAAVWRPIATTARMALELYNKKRNFKTTPEP